MMAYLPVTKHPPVSASLAEAATNFKMLQFICTGLFRGSHAHFEGTLPKKKYTASQLRACDSFIYDESMLTCKIMSKAGNLTTEFGYVSM